MTSQTPDRSIPYQQPGAGRLRDLDGRRWRGQARREALVERAVAAPGVGFVQVVVVVGVEEVALVEVERVAERVVAELPDARAPAPPHPLAEATAAAAEAAAHRGAQPVPQRAQRRRRRGRRRRLHPHGQR